MTNYLLVFIFFLIVILIATFLEYHKLIIKSVNEVYEAFPETKKGLVFRELYYLYSDGVLSNESKSEERRRRWDGEAVAMLNKHFDAWCKKNYLLDTGRRIEIDSVTPLETNRFNDALYYIKNLMDKGFDVHFKA